MIIDCKYMFRQYIFEIREANYIEYLILDAV